MKSIAYTTFRTRAWQSFKDYCRAFKLPRTERSFLRFAAASRGAQIAFRSPDHADMALFQSELVCLLLWKFRRIRHYFLAPGVADFCVNAVKELSPDYSSTLPQCPPVEGIDGVSTLQSGFALHFPATERNRSIICIPNFLAAVNDFTAYQYYAAASDGDTVVVLQRACAVRADDPDMLRLEKTVFGFSLYIDAFPEVIHAGDPGDIHTAAHYHGPHTLIGRAPVVDEEERGALTPHWRRGHFHLLTHPRYTRKRFQSVYVSGCFVRGAALEVDNDAPALKSA